MFLFNQFILCPRHKVYTYTLSHIVVVVVVVEDDVVVVTNDFDIEVFELSGRRSDVECRRLVTLDHVEAITSRRRLARVDNVDVEWRT